MQCMLMSGSAKRDRRLCRCRVDAEGDALPARRGGRVSVPHSLLHCPYTMMTHTASVHMPHWACHYGGPLTMGQSNWLLAALPGIWTAYCLRSSP